MIKFNDIGLNGHVTTKIKLLEIVLDYISLTLLGERQSLIKIVSVVTFINEVRLLLVPG